MLAAIEAGGTKVVCAVGTGPEDLGSVVRFPTTTPEETLGRVLGFLREHGDVEAVGIASFGPVDLRRGSPTYGCITSTPKPGWRGTDVVGAVGGALGVPVGFDTDVNGAALGEARWGAGRGLGTVVYVTVGTGVGGGALVDGRPLHGLLHPEMGHLLVRRHPDDDFAGTCPFHGDCLEGLAAGPAVQARFGRPGAELDGAERDQAVAFQAHYLGQLAASLALVLSPERIILGGGAMQLPGLLAAVRLEAAAALNGYLDHPSVDDGSLLVSPGLGDRAGVLGALVLAEQALAGT
jgi:fructokinase